MDTAKRFAQLSTAKRLQVGAIIVKDDRIISIGYNGTPAGWHNDCEYWVEDGDLGSGWKTRPEVIHAEANAIAKLAKSSESGDGSTMFLTHSPCMDCAKQIFTAGIKKVYFGNNYRSDDGINFLKKCDVDVEKV
jgi:dCMP deaminase